MWEILAKEKIIQAYLQGDVMTRTLTARVSKGYGLLEEMQDLAEEIYRLAGLAVPSR